MAITPKLMTADELFRLPNDHLRHELVRGELRTMRLRTVEQGVLSSDIGCNLGNYVESHWLGSTVIGVGCILARDPDTVRVADIEFIRQARVPKGKASEGYFQGAPDLTIDVVSRDDTYTEVSERVDEWLAHGTRLVIIVDPRRRVVAVHRPNGTVITLGIDDTLDGEDVVLGWSLAIRDLFDEE